MNRAQQPHVDQQANGKIDIELFLFPLLLLFFSGPPGLPGVAGKDGSPGLPGPKGERAVGPTGNNNILFSFHHYNFSHLM